MSNAIWHLLEDLEYGILLQSNLKFCQRWTPQIDHLSKKKEAAGRSPVSSIRYPVSGIRSVSSTSRNIVGLECLSV